MRQEASYALISEYRKIVENQGIEYVESELGIGANKVNSDLITNIILSEIYKQEYPFTSHIYPYIILISGHPGAGKTTTSTILSKSIHAPVIHSDRVRYEVGELANGSHLGPQIPIVSSIRNNLVRLISEQSCHIVIDQFTNPVRATIIATIARSNNSRYKILNVFLHTPESLLVKRLGERIPTQNFNTGTIEHLKIYKNQIWESTPEVYDIIFNTETLSPTEIALCIGKLIQ